MPNPEKARFGSEDYEFDIAADMDYENLVREPSADMACPGPSLAINRAAARGAARVWDEDTRELRIPTNNDYSDWSDDDPDKTFLLEREDSDKTLPLPDNDEVDEDDEEKEFEYYDEAYYQFVDDDDLLEPLANMACPQDRPSLELVQPPVGPIDEPFWRYVFRGERANWSKERKLEYVRYVRRTQTFATASAQRWRSGEFQIPRVKKAPMEGCQTCNAKFQHTELDLYPRCNPDILKCKYVRCSAPNRKGHMTDKCPDLNEICSTCYMRGNKFIYLSCVEETKCNFFSFL
jgi:hypothetical protein